MNSSDFDLTSVMSPNERVVFETYVKQIDVDLKVKKEAIKQFSTTNLSRK